MITCGKSIKESKRAAEWLGQRRAPEYVMERLHRAEKAVDTQICCDALQLAAQGRLDRLFLYSNDLDFLPLCRTLKSFGANINLIRLTSRNVNKQLVQECDGFDVMPERELDACFGVRRK